MNEENKNIIDEVKKYFDEKTEETKRHFDVAVEDMKSDFKVFGEGQSAIREKVDLLETKVDSLETKVDSLVEDMDYVKSTLADNKERFKETADKTTVDDHEIRITGLESAAMTKA